MGDVSNTPCDRPPTPTPPPSPTPCISATPQPCAAPAFQGMRWLNDDMSLKRPVSWRLDEATFRARGQPGSVWRSQALGAASVWNAALGPPAVLAEAVSFGAADIVIRAKNDTEWPVEPPYLPDDYGTVFNLHQYNQAIPVCAGGENLTRVLRKEMWIHAAAGLTWNDTGTFQAHNDWLQSRKNVLLHEFGHVLLVDEAPVDCPDLTPPEDSQPAMCSKWDTTVGSPVVVTPLLDDPAALMDALGCLWP